MNTKLLALCVLTSASFCASATKGFAPYDKDKGFGFDVRFQGNFTNNDTIIGNHIFSFDINGYHKGESGWFWKFGIPVFILPSSELFIPVPWPLPNLQIGKYVPDLGALRVGLFHGFPGLGADAWVIPGRLMTTLELFGMKPRNEDITFGLSWLNRLFITDAFYIAAGINHFAESGRLSGINFGFIGVGAAF